MGTCKDFKTNALNPNLHAHFSVAEAESPAFAGLQFVPD
jgi:hypothetical protein